MARSHRWWLTALSALLLINFFVTVWLNIARYEAYNSGAFDVGAISQAIWSVTQGELLITTFKGISVSRLAEHVEFFYFLLVPLYALRPHPTTLFIFQSALYVLGGIAVYRLARRRWQHTGAAVAATAVYLYYPVAQSAVLFEFHADTLAMPLLLFAIEAQDRRDWRAYWVWLVLALSCKFYVSVPVMGMGLLLWWQGQRRQGIATALTGLIWGLVAFFLVRGLFAPPNADEVKATADSYISFYFGSILNIGGYDLLRRLATGLVIYTPAALYGRFAMGWIGVASSIILPALFSTGPGPAYDYRFHHYALAVPFLVAAIIYGADYRRQLPSTRWSWQPGIVFTVAMTVLFNALLLDTPLNPTFYRPPPLAGQGLDNTGYLVTERDELKDAWLAQVIPPDAAVVSDKLLGLRLVNRETFYLTQPLFGSLGDLLPHVDYVVTDALFDSVISNGQEIIAYGVYNEYAAIQRLLAEPTLPLLQTQDGLVLFGRGEAGLTQRVDLIPGQVHQPLLAHFGDEIGLIAVDIELIGASRWQVQADWVALRPLHKISPRFAVSRLEGIPHSRIVHLPSMALLPTTEWPTNQIVRETFDFQLDEELTSLPPLWVGWYDSHHPAAAFTDERSRIGDEVELLK